MTPVLRTVRTIVLVTAAVFVLITGLHVHVHEGERGAADHCTVCNLAPAPPPDPPVLPSLRLTGAVEAPGPTRADPGLPVAALRVAPKTSPPSA